MRDRVVVETEYLRGVVSKAASECVQFQAAGDRAKFADAVWREFLQAYGQMAAVAGAPPTAGEPHTDALRQACMRGLLDGMVDALAAPAQRWHAFSQDQRHTSKLLRTNPKLVATYEAAFAPERASASTRQLFDAMPALADKHRLTVRKSDDSDALEWDDAERGECGDITLAAFTKRRSRARIKGGQT